MCHMDIQKRSLLLIVLLSASGGYILRQSTASLETKTVTKDVIKDRIVTVTRTVKAPDGTITRDRRTEQDRAATRREEAVAQVAAPIKDWRLTGGYMIDKVYTGGLERRVLGPVFLGLQADTQGHVGATLSIEF
jgi:hypothetical protein